MSLAAWSQSTHWAFSTERAGVLAERNPWKLALQCLPSAQSKDVKSWKGPATRPTLCMVKLQSQEGTELLSHGDHELFPAQAGAQNSSPRISTLDLGHAAGLCVMTGGLSGY